VIWDYQKGRVLGRRKGIFKHIVLGRIKGAMALCSRK